MDPGCEGEVDHALANRRFEVVEARYLKLGLKEVVGASVEPASDDADLYEEKLLCGANQSNHGLVHLGEMGSILDRVVSGHYTRRNHQNAQNVVFNLQGRAHSDHHARESDLIQVVVQNLTQRTAVVSSTRLLSINRVYCLVPKVCEPNQQPDPAWQSLREAWVKYADCHESSYWEN